MATSPTIPCIKLPSGKDLKVSLPLGVELKSMVDLSKGPPTDCALIHSLMLQLMPALGGMACFLKLITVIQKALDVINSGPSGFHRRFEAGDSRRGLPVLVPATPVVYLTAVKDILFADHCLPRMLHRVRRKRPQISGWHRFEFCFRQSRVVGFIVLCPGQ